MVAPGENGVGVELVQTAASVFSFPSASKICRATRGHQPANPEEPAGLSRPIARARAGPARRMARPWPAKPVAADCPGRGSGAGPAERPGLPRMQGRSARPGGPRRPAVEVRRWPSSASCRVVRRLRRSPFRGRKASSRACRSGPPTRRRRWESGARRSAAEIGDGEIGFVADSRRPRAPGMPGWPGDHLVVEGPEIFDAPRPAAEDDRGRGRLRQLRRGSGDTGAAPRPGQGRGIEAQAT